MPQTLRGAGLIAVAAILASLGLAAPAHAETAAITGHITDHAGAPAAGVSLFTSNEDGTSIGSARTDAAGAYRIANLKPGRFYLELRVSWGGIKLTDRFDVAGETVFDYALPAVGSVQGRLSNQDGSGASGVNVNVAGSGSVTTDANGDWRVPQAFAGSDLVVTYSDPRQGILQYAYGKLTQAAADRITVAAGQTTTVNEVVLPTGSVRVTAKDSVTGAPMLNVIASARYARQETSTGEAILEGVTAGTHRLWVDWPGYIAQDIKEVTVVAGQRVDVEVTLTPEARIDVTVVDAATGEPLRGVCVAAVSPRGLPTEGCWNTTGDDGRLTLAGLSAGGHQLIAVPTEAPGYGAQWVGTSRGTGRQHLAVTVQALAGQTVTGPVVRMDRAGTITGVVTKADGSAPLHYGTVVGLLPSVRSSGELPPGAVGVDESGRYTLDSLGPYDWALFFTEVREAGQYSGGVAGSLLARTVRVTAGASATYDFRFRAAVRLTVKAAGTSSGIEAVNAFTGYVMGHGYGPESTFLIVGPQFVRFRTEEGRGSPGVHWIPSSGSKTVELSFG